MSDKFRDQAGLSRPLPFGRSHAAVRRPLIAVASQSEFGADGQIRDPDDLPAQLRMTVRQLANTLSSAQATLSDLVKLTAFYVPDGATNEAKLLALLSKALPEDCGVAVSAVPVPALGAPGLRLHVQALAVSSSDVPLAERRQVRMARLPALPPPFVHGLRCGELIFPSAQTGRDLDGNMLCPGDIVGQSRLAMDRLSSILQGLGADLDDVVKQNRWSSGDPSEEAWKPAALAVSDRYAEPGPVATGIDLPEDVVEGALIKIDVLAMRSRDDRRMERRHAWPNGHWDWPIHLAYKHGLRCGDLVFVGGQVSWNPQSLIIDPGDMAAQTGRAIENIDRILADLDASLDDVVQVTSFFNPLRHPGDAPRNWNACRQAFKQPGPAITGIPNGFPTYPEMLTEIEAIASVNAAMPSRVKD